MLWRRSFDVPPPDLADDDQYSQVGDPRYADLGDEMPRAEALKQVIDRLLPYWDAGIVPDLRAGHTVLIAAHGNSLRALVKYLDNMGLVYQYKGRQGRPTLNEGAACTKLIA